MKTEKFSRIKKVLNEAEWVRAIDNWIVTDVICINNVLFEIPDLKSLEKHSEGRQIDEDAIREAIKTWCSKEDLEEAERINLIWTPRRGLTVELFKCNSGYVGIQKMFADIFPKGSSFYWDKGKPYEGAMIVKNGCIDAGIVATLDLTIYRGILPELNFV